MTSTILCRLISLPSEVSLAVLVDVLESLYTSHSVPDSTRIDTALESLGFHTDQNQPSRQRLLFYPNVLEAERRGRLWPRCITGMLLQHRRLVRQRRRPALAVSSPRGTLSKEEVEQIRSFKFEVYKKRPACNGATPNKRKRQTNCVICLKTFRKNSTVKQLPCDHIFHANCIDKSLRFCNARCCLCRQKVVIPSCSTESPPHLFGRGLACAPAV